MGIMKRLSEEANGDLLSLMDKNPYTRENTGRGARVRVTWGKKWGKGKPGDWIEGELLATFVTPSRALIGEVMADIVNGRKLAHPVKRTAPWSRRWVRRGWVQIELKGE